MLSTDPIDILLDDDHEIVFEGGDIQWSAGLQGSAQDVKINTGMIAGELFYDLDEGIALFKREGVDPSRALLGEKFSKAKVIAEFTPAIRRSAGIVDILTIGVSFDSKTRETRVRYEADTEFDDTVADSLAVGG